MSEISVSSNVFLRKKIFHVIVVPVQVLLQNPTRTDLNPTDKHGKLAVLHQSKSTPDLAPLLNRRQMSLP